METKRDHRESYQLEALSRKAHRLTSPTAFGEGEWIEVWIYCSDLGPVVRLVTEIADGSSPSASQGHCSAKAGLKSCNFFWDFKEISRLLGCDARSSWINRWRSTHFTSVTSWELSLLFRLWGLSGLRISSMTYWPSPLRSTQKKAQARVLQLIWDTGALIESLPHMWSDSYSLTLNK